VDSSRLFSQWHVTVRVQQVVLAFALFAQPLLLQFHFISLNHLVKGVFNLWFQSWPVPTGALSLVLLHNLLLEEGQVRQKTVNCRGHQEPLCRVDFFCTIVEVCRLQVLLLKNVFVRRINLCE
jgi:hypothetical protein